MPTTITTTVYSFDELSDDAKQHAIDQERRNGRSCPTEIPWCSEYGDSLQAFCERFGVTTKVGYDDRSYIQESTLPEYGENIQGLRLRTYLLNNYDDVLYQREERYAEQSLSLLEMMAGRQRKSRISRIFREETCCPFTGFCGDENLLDPIRAFVKDPTSKPATYDLNDLLTDCVHSFNLAWEAEVNDYYSDETISEYLREPDFQFTEDGELV